MLFIWKSGKAWNYLVPAFPSSKLKVHQSRSDSCPQLEDTEKCRNNLQYMDIPNRCCLFAILIATN